MIAAAVLAAAGALVSLWSVEARGSGEMAEHDAPMRVRNLSPATHLFGLPRPVGPVLPAGAREIAVTVDHANNFSARSGPRTVAYFDGTTTVTSLSLRHATGADLEWGVELPWVVHGGGATDRLIDGWHDLFGMPDGGRSAAPRDQLDYRIVHDGIPLLHLVESGGYRGDVRGWVGYRLHEAADRSAALRAMVKLPTGRLRHLSGSEGADVSLTLELTDRRWLAPFGVTVTLAAAVTRLGDGELIPSAQRDWVASGHLGLHMAVWRNLSLHAQLDAHSDVIDAGVPEVAGRAVQATVGGRVALPWSFALDLGVTEDLTRRSAPDVVFHSMLSRRF